MIAKNKNDLYIEKKDDRFYVKDSDNNTLIICHSYLDAIVELENIYSTAIKYDSNNISNELQNSKRKALDFELVWQNC